MADATKSAADGGRQPLFIAGGTARRRASQQPAQQPAPSSASAAHPSGGSDDSDEPVAVASLPPALQPLLGPYADAAGMVSPAAVARATRAYADHQRSRVWRGCWWWLLAAVVVLGLLIGVAWGVAATAKTAATAPDGAMTALSNGQLVTVNGRTSRQALPLTSFLPRQRLLDLGYLSLTAANAGGTSTSDAALAVLGVVTTSNASGFPFVTVVTEAGDVLLAGSAVTADWAAIGVALGLPQLAVNAPKVAGAWARPAPSAGADLAYQQNVAVCEYRTTGAPNPPVGGRASAAYATACAAQRAYEAARMAALRAGGAQ
jgi:hypothetical protein